VFVTSQFCTTCHRTYAQHHEFCPLDGTILKDMPTELPDVATVINGRYMILAPVNAGGMGTIYRCQDIGLHREIALKVLRPDLAARENAVRRFFIEARAASALDHPGIVRLHDFGVSQEGFLFLAMEYLPGLTLADLLRARRRLSVGEALLIAQETAAALAHAHQRGIVHRDLKPENVFLVVDRESGNLIKILDFGVASVFEAGACGGLHTGTVLGTPEYMSPEQVRGDVVDGRSDLYSLGLLLFEMLAGSPPFVGDSPGEVMRMHLSQAPRSLPALSVPPGIRQGLDRLLMSLLAKIPDQRPATAQDLLEHLRETTLQVSSGNVDAVNVAMFQDAIAPLRSMEPFRLEPWAGRAGAEAKEAVRPGDNVAELIEEPEPAQGLLGPRAAVPWTVAREARPSTQKSPVITLIHIEFDYGGDEGMPLSPRTMFLPEVEAFQTHTMARGGTVLFDSGHEVRIVFGMYPSGMDGAQEAFVCAQDLVRRAARFRTAIRLPIEVRVGIATDQVPAHAIRASQMDHGVRGSAVDVAIRLAHIALPGQVVIDENTRKALGQDMPLMDLGQIPVRGDNRQVRIFGTPAIQEKKA